MALRVNHFALVLASIQLGVAPLTAVYIPLCDDACLERVNCPVYSVIKQRSCPGQRICCAPTESNEYLSIEDYSWLFPCGNSTYVDAGAPFGDTHAQIVGGVEARPAEFPWQVSILENSIHTCGGVLINDGWVLTAAHCVSDEESDYAVILGEHDRFETDPSEIERVVNDSSIIIHPGYIALTSRNDIALVQIDPVGVFTASVTPACLPNATADYIGMECVVSGWGITGEFDSKAAILQYTRLHVMDSDECQTFHQKTIHDGNICATYPGGGRGACSGDSGGPLVCQVDGIFHLIGIVSWSDVGCWDPVLPGVYSDVAFYLDWISFTVSSTI